MGFNHGFTLDYQTWLAGKPPNNMEISNGEIIEINGWFSRKPCLIT